MSRIDQIIDYEQGTLSDSDTLRLFANMIRDKSVYSLQGHYGRTARALIEDEFIDEYGNLTEKALDFMELNE